MRTSFVHANTHISHVQSGKVLREGSSVLVRILSDRGNGSYEASVAGQKLILSSKTLLKPGTTFIGTISLKNGNIEISRGSEINIPVQVEPFSVVNEESSLFSPVISESLSVLLESLNLPSDYFSVNILQQFKQLGLPMDARIMRKIRNLAVRTSNPVKSMEKLVSLYQKGVDINKLSIEDFDNEYETDNFQRNEKRFNSIKDLFLTFLQNESGKKAGKLTVYNHLGFKKDSWQESSWIIIPFEIVSLEDLITGRGSLSMLLGSSNKDLKKLNISMEYEEEKWLFLIEFSNRKPSKILFSSSSVEPSEKDKKCSELAKMTKCPVEWRSINELEGNASRTEELNLLGNGGYI